MADPFSSQKPGAVVPQQPTAPLFDINALTQANTLVDAQKIFTDTMSSVTKAKSAAEIENLGKSQDLLNTTVTEARRLFSEQEKTRQNIITAQSRRQSIEKVPPLVGRILGLFDKDWDWGHWNEIVRANKLALSANEDQFNQLQVMSKLQQDVLNNSLMTLNAQYGAIEQQFRMGLDFRKVVEEESQRAFDNKLKIESNARDAARFGMQQIQFDQQQAQYAVSQLSDEDLASAASEGNQDAVRESQKRQGDRLALLTAAQGAEANDETMQNSGRQRFMLSQDAESLTSLAEKAADNGGSISFPVQISPTQTRDVTFTASELRKAAVDRAGIDQAVQKSATDRLVAVGLTKYHTDQMMSMGLAIGTTVGQGKMTVGIEQAIHKTLTSIQAAQATGDVMSAAAYAEAGFNQVSKAVEDIILAQPKESQQFVRDQFNGQLSTPDTATNFLGDVIFNKSALSQSNIMSPYMRQVSAEADKLAQTSLMGPDGKISVGNMQDAMTNKSQIANTAIGNVMNDTITPDGAVVPGIRSQFQNDRNAMALDMAVSDMIQKRMPFMEGVNLGEFVDPNNPKNISLSKFLGYLRNKYYADVQTGTVPMTKVRMYDKQFMEYMLSADFQQKVAQAWSPNLMTDRALFQLISPDGNPLDQYTEWYSYQAQEFDKKYAAEQATINNISADQNMLQFRHKYAPQISQLANDLMARDPNRTYADARKEAETSIYRQIESHRKMNLMEGSSF